MARFTENVDEMVDSTGGPRFSGRHRGGMGAPDVEREDGTTPGSESSS
jgi:hypothetical protein